MEHDERAHDAQTQDEHATGEPTTGARGAAKGAARSQHTLHVLPHDWSLLRRVLSPVLERAGRAAAKRKAGEPSGPAVLVLTPDVDAAHAAAGTARALLDGEAAAFLPVTAPGRAARLLRDAAPLGVSGTPAALLELVRASTLKLDDVKTAVVAWGDDLLAAGAGPDLEAILGELPKGERIMVAGAMTEELEQLVERYMRRPRRADAPDEAEAERLPTTVHYLTVAAASRPAALRRLLDELDPASAAIVAPGEDAAADARLALATLGYRADDAQVRVTSDVVPEGTELVVLYELPQDAATVRRASVASQVVALVQPRQLAALRRLTGGNVAAFTLSDARRAAQSREEAMRDELRRLLATGQFTRELMTLEPLLAEHDGVEIAAALLRLVDEGRRRRPAEARRAASYLMPEAEPAMAAPAAAPVAAAPAAAPAAPAAYAPHGATPAWTRVFVNVGTRDGAGAGDILGALAGEAGVERTKIGRIEMRDSHSLAEVSTDVVERVVEAANGGMMRGRALVVRVDQGSDRPARPIGRHDRGDRSPRSGGDRFDRGDRGDRAPRGGGARFERSDRGERGDREERPRGGFGRDRGERPARDDRGGPPRREGGYRPREGGFKPREGGFKPREGGFKPREGGFKPREGGFKPRGEGGFKPRGEGGFRGPREGGRDAGPRGGGGAGPRGGGGGFRNAGDERRASFGRTLNDEQREWSDRAERVRNARRPRNDE